MRNLLLAFLLLNLMFGSSCLTNSKDVSSKEENEKWVCDSLVCFLLEKQSNYSEEYPSFELKIKIKNKPNLSLVEVLPDELLNEFRFNFHQQVYNVIGKDTLWASFSHLEENAGVNPYFSQILGFGPIEKSKKFNNKIKFNDIYFTNKTQIFEL